MVRHKEPTWGSSLMALPRRDKVAALAALLASVALLLGLWLWGSSRTAPVAEASGSTAVPSSVASPAPAPAPAAVPSDVDPDQAPAPGMDPELAPPDGPALDYPPFDVDAEAMRGELRTHGVEVPDDKLYMLVNIADKYIAEDDPDLDAWDPRIMRDVRAMDPKLDRDHLIDVTRCTAEYIERVIARNKGWAHPPDSDDHDHTVDGRGQQPRVGGTNGGN